MAAAEKEPTQQIKKVILLHLPQNLGDTMFAVQALKKIHDYCAKHHLTLLTFGKKQSHKNAELLCGKRFPYKRKPDITTKEKQTAQQLLSLNCSHHNIKSLPSDLPVHRIPLPFKKSDNISLSKESPIGKKHILILIEECLRKAGILKEDEDLGEPKLPKTFISVTTRQRIREKFNIQSKDYALLIPGGAGRMTPGRWPAENFAQIAKNLYEKDIQPVLIGGTTTSAKHICDNVQQMSDVPVLNLCGQTSVDEIGTLAREAIFTLGNATGPLHIAGASNGKVFALFGHENNPETWSPPGKNVILIHKKNRNVQDIPVEEVALKVSFACPEEKRLRDITTHIPRGSLISP